MTGLRIVWRCWLLTAVLLLTLETAAHAGTISLTATLDGAQETPPHTTTGIGAASFILDDVAGTLLSSVTFSNLTSPTFLDGLDTAAHIHFAPAGVAGPIVHPYPVASPQDPLGVPIGVTSGSFADVWTGLTPADITTLESGGAYINIHTVAFPMGEIRGQILSIVPEPASLVLLSLGLVGAAGLAWRAARSNRAG